MKGIRAEPHRGHVNSAEGLSLLSPGRGREQRWSFLLSHPIKKPLANVLLETVIQYLWGICISVVNNQLICFLGWWSERAALLITFIGEELAGGGEKEGRSNPHPDSHPITPLQLPGF